MDVEFDLPGEYLPSTYSYNSKVTTANITTFSIKEVVDKNSSEVWLKEFSELNDMTWRILRTYPNSGKINVFKIALRCQHFTDRRAKNVRTTKNTNCPAELSLTVRRFIKKSRAQHVDNTIAEFPTLVVLKNHHNHAFRTAAVLKYKNLSNDEGVLPPPQWFFPLGKNPTEQLENDLITQTIQHEDHNSLAVKTEQNRSYQNSTVEARSSSDNRDVDAISDEEHKQLKHIFKRIEDGLHLNPTAFGPAVKQMLSNSQLYETECGLLSALHTFGTYSGLKPKEKVSNRQRRCHKLKIGLQPTALDRRKHYRKKKIDL